MSVPVSDKSAVLLVAERGFGRCGCSLGPILYLLNLSCFSKMDLKCLGFGFFCLQFCNQVIIFTLCLRTAVFLFSCEISHSLAAECVWWGTWAVPSN